MYRSLVFWGPNELKNFPRQSTVIKSTFEIVLYTIYVLSRPMELNGLYCTVSTFPLQFAEMYPSFLTKLTWIVSFIQRVPKSMKKKDFVKKTKTFNFMLTEFLNPSSYTLGQIRFRTSNVEKNQIFLYFCNVVVIDGCSTSLFGNWFGACTLYIFLRTLDLCCRIHSFWRKVNLREDAFFSVLAIVQKFQIAWDSLY